MKKLNANRLRLAAYLRHEGAVQATEEAGLEPWAPPEWLEGWARARAVLGHGLDREDRRLGVLVVAEAALRVVPVGADPAWGARIDLVKRWAEAGAVTVQELEAAAEAATRVAAGEGEAAMRVAAPWTPWTATRAARAARAAEKAAAAAAWTARAEVAEVAAAAWTAWTEGEEAVSAWAEAMAEEAWAATLFWAAKAAPAPEAEEAQQAEELGAALAKAAQAA